MPPLLITLFVVQACDTGFQFFNFMFCSIVENGELLDESSNFPLLFTDDDAEREGDCQKEKNCYKEDEVCWCLEP